MKENHENLRLSASQRGFTLLEVLIALVILSLGLLALASLTTTVIRNNSFSDDFTTATALAQDKLEELVNTSFGSMTSSSDTVNQDGTAGSKYSRTWTIGTGTNSKTIQVDVGWTSNLGISKTISVYTVRGNS